MSPKLPTRLAFVTALLIGPIAIAQISNTPRNDGASKQCVGCACNCGPGFRLPNGYCATWGQHYAFQAAGGYPQGTVDELDKSQANGACPKVDIEAKRRYGRR
jgi:hypothetical protein